MSKIDLCWIDDSPAEMALIMEHVFPTIWANNFSCKTILFGNDYCSMESENGPTEVDRQEFEDELNNFFIVFCQKIDEDEWLDIGTTYKAKKDLLPTPSVSRIPMWEEGKKTLENFRGLANSWMNKEGLQELKKNPKELLADTNNETSSDSNSLSVVKLIEEMNIPKEAAVALDICLLYHDIVRIEAGIPSISMALYHLLKKEHDCYLYSGRYDARTLMNSWTKTYQQIFGDEEAVKVHPKKGLTTKQSVTEAKSDLIALLRKKEGGS